MNKPLKILQASAGSGKTFSLTAHYLTLLFSGENKYREILAVTFTNKATEEMKSRILVVLKGFALGDESFNSYFDIVLAAHPSLNKASLKLKADLIYRKILHDYSRFSINTIDGFVQKVIRGFAFELGLDANYTLEMNYDKVRSELADKLDKTLDAQPQLLQWIIDLAMDRIDNNQSWNYRNELLNLTDEIFKERYQPFEKAINELAKTVDINQLFKDYKTLSQQNITNFEDKVMQLATTATEIFEVLAVETQSLKGKSRSPLLNLNKITIGNFDKIIAINKLVNQPEEWMQKGQANSLFEELNPTLKNLVETYKNGLATYTTDKKFNENLYYLRLMQEMAVQLKSYREENDNLLISDAQNLLKGITDDADDNPSFIWEKMGNRYRNFLFDEFQDTSANQWGSFKSLLTNAMASPSGKLIDHLIVGDTKQSIYRWRNGDWNILHQQAQKDVGKHNVMNDSLAENYRSTTNIINFNNNIFTALPQLLQQQLNTTISKEETESSILPWWQAAGFNQIVTDVYANAVQKITAKTLKGGTIKFKVLKTEEDGAALNKTTFTALAIAKMVEEIKYLTTVKNYKLKEICVLVRKNDEAIATVNALLANGINVISGEALLIANNCAVKLLINTLQVFAGTTDNTSLYKANCISLYAKQQGKIAEPASFFALKFKTLAQLTNVLPLNLCQQWQSWLHLPLPALLEKLILAYDLNFKTNDLSYLLALRDLAGNFAQQGEKGIAAFISFWEEEGVKKTLPTSETANAVQVITIHKAKGLAFSAVLLPFCNWSLDGMINGIFWVPAANTPYHLLQEIPLKYNAALASSTVAKPYFEELLFNQMDALNILYVATTRAKEYLYISTLGKKTDTITNIGDLLVKALADNLTADDEYILNETVIAKKEEITVPEETIINLTHYPTSDRLSQVFDANLKRKEIDLLTGENAARIGSILHEVLALANHITEIDNVLNKLLAEGLFKAEEFEQLKTQAIAVLNNTDLQNILNNSKQRLTEQSIIATNGKSYRPDKVLISDGDVTIIDYKFTLTQSDNHIKQVDGYKKLLLAMGYSNVKTYLFYANTGELKLV